MLIVYLRKDPPCPRKRTCVLFEICMKGTYVAVSDEYIGWTCRSVSGIGTDRERCSGLGLYVHRTEHKSISRHVFPMYPYVRACSGSQQTRLLLVIAYAHGLQNSDRSDRLY